MTGGGRSGAAHLSALFTFLGLSLVFSPQPGAGQEGQLLTLDEALERAIVSNPNYQRTLNNLELNDIERQRLE